MRQWSEQEKSVLEESFEYYLNDSTELPGYKAIRDVKAKNACLSTRSEAQIKIMISNMRKRKMAQTKSNKQDQGGKRQKKK